MLKILKLVSFLLIIPVLTSCSLLFSQELVGEVRELPIREQAPSFTLLTQKGETVSLDDYIGKIIYINVWASWSETSKQEMLALQEAYQFYKDREDVVFLSVVSANDKKYGNINPVDVSEKEILALAEEYGISYPILFDTEDNFMEAYMVSDFPTQIFITSDGVLDSYIRDALTAENLVEILESAYQEKRYLCILVSIG